MTRLGFLREVTSPDEGAVGKLSEFINANPEGLVFVKNTTEGVNTVLRSLDLKPGDEIIVTNHSYASLLECC